MNYKQKKNKFVQNYSLDEIFGIEKDKIIFAISFTNSGV